MSYEHLSSSGIDYLPCRYGKSKLLFRGPRKRLDAPYVAIAGSSEVYGKFIEEPMSEVLEKNLGKTVVNLGVLNAGVDAFLNDPSALELLQSAETVVLQIMGAQNMSNRLYSVHPRRNDRFLNSSQFLQTLYRNIDFTQFHYTRHMLGVLLEESAERYELIKEELQSAWLSRMQTLIELIGGRVILMWIGSDGPDVSAKLENPTADPLFVNRAMLDALAMFASDTVVVVATPEEIDAGQSRMVYSQLEEPIAREMLGPVVHETAARALANILDDKAA